MKLFWAPQTRSARAIWMLEEAGVDYELERVNINDPERKDSAEFLEASPMGKVPAIMDEADNGTVYMAEQQAPVIRRVALKIIKLGMDTKQVVARFEAERQALAMMDHPNIAKVFEAGSTEHGRPFFAMELVRGILVIATGKPPCGVRVSVETLAAASITARYSPLPTTTVNGWNADQE